MSRIVVLLMPWGRVGSNLVNGIVKDSGSRRIWNEPLTGVQTRVIRGGGKRPDVWPAQLEWMREHIKGSDERIFFNVAADSVGDAGAFREYMAQFFPKYIVLDRRDDLATAVSALRTRAWRQEGAEKGEERRWNIPSGTVVSFRPFIDPVKLRAAFSNIERGRKNIAEITDGSKARVFFYEDLVSDMRGIAAEILAEADIPAYDFKAKTGKFGSKNLSEMVENAEDVMRFAVERGITTDLSV